MSDFSIIQESLEKLRSTLLDDRLKVKDKYLFTRAAAYIDYKIKVSDSYLTIPSVISSVENLISKSTSSLLNFAETKSESDFLASSDQILNATKETMGFVQVQNQAENTYLLDAVKTNDLQIINLAKSIEKLNQALDQLGKDAANHIEKLKTEFQNLVDGTEDKVGWKQEIRDGIARIEESFQLELLGDGKAKKGWVSEASKVQLQLDSILKDGENLGVIIGVNGQSKEERKSAEIIKLGFIAQSCEAILNSIGLGASVGSYTKRANQESLSGAFWTFCMFILFIGVVYLNSDLIKYFENHAGSNSIYDFLLIRLVASIPFIAFMMFAGFKAKNHRKMELKYRQFELELAAFEPNLPSLQKEIRSFAKLMFIQKTFGNFDETNGHQELDVDGLSKHINATKKAIESIDMQIKNLVNQTKDTA